MDTPRTDTSPLARRKDFLPHANFADRFSVVVPGNHFDAETAAKAVLSKPPKWFAPLMKLRHTIVRPFGLKTQLAAEGADKIGIFPVIRKSAQALVLGLDDRHLDFRLLVEISDRSTDDQELSVTTFVQTHNWLGRIYLAIVMPFHKLIVPAMLSRARI